MSTAHPALRQTVLDCPDPRRLGDFYRDLLGYEYRPGDETPEEGEDWLVIRPAGGGHGLAFQANAEYVPPVWTPEPDRPGDQQMMLHLDFEVTDLAEATARAQALGATLPEHQPQDDVRVLLDPAGHPFCLYTS